MFDRHVHERLGRSTMVPMRSVSSKCAAITTSSAFGLRVCRRALPLRALDGQHCQFTQQRVCERQLFETERAADPFGVAVAGIIAQPDAIGLRREPVCRRSPARRAPTRACCSSTSTACQIAPVCTVTTWLSKSIFSTAFIRSRPIRMQPSRMPWPMKVEERPQMKMGTAEVVRHAHDRAHLLGGARPDDDGGDAAGVRPAVARVADAVHQLIADVFRAADGGETFGEIAQFASFVDRGRVGIEARRHEGHREAWKLDTGSCLLIPAP